jgi:hypothetical protein
MNSICFHFCTYTHLYERARFVHVRCMLFNGCLVVLALI